MDFKFFQKPKPLGNMYLGFNMDDVLLNVLRWKQYHNEDILTNDTPIEAVGVPIFNCWLRILNWRNYTNVNPEMIEIDYRVIETNTTPTNFTLKMETHQFLRRIELSTIHINGL